MRKLLAILLFLPALAWGQGVLTGTDPGDTYGGLVHFDGNTGIPAVTPGQLYDGLGGLLPMKASLTTISFTGIFTMTQVNAASGSANPFDYTGTLGIMNGSDDFTLFDVNMTNANHTGSNTVQILDVAAITGDAEATETAINIGAGWDSGITSASPITGSALTTAGAATAASAVIGGGYGDTGATVSAAGVGQFNGALTTDGALTAASAAVGGGYGSTGCSISDAGVLQCNGAATTDGALTADSAVIGGGYGSTGATISTAGVVQANGALTADGAITSGANGADGSLTIYSEQGGTDYSVVFQPHVTMTQTTTYVMPANDGDASQFLQTDGAGALTWAAGGGVEVDGVVGNEVTNVTNASLVRAGAGTGGDPYTLALNLSSSNTWAAQQLFGVGSEHYLAAAGSVITFAGADAAGNWKLIDMSGAGGINDANDSLIYRSGDNQWLGTGALFSSGYVARGNPGVAEATYSVYYGNAAIIKEEQTNDADELTMNFPAYSDGGAGNQSGEYDATSTLGPQREATQTVADSGADANPAAFTLTPTAYTNLYTVTCSDDDGCTMTVAETDLGSVALHGGYEICIIQATDNYDITWTDAAGAALLSGNWVGATAGDVVCAVYSTSLSAYVETSRSDN